MKTIEYKVIVPDQEFPYETHKFFWSVDPLSIEHYADGILIESAKGSKAMDIFKKYFGNGSTRLEKKCTSRDTKAAKGTGSKNRPGVERYGHVPLFSEREFENGDTSEKDIT